MTLAKAPSPTMTTLSVATSVRFHYYLFFKSVLTWIAHCLDIIRQQLMCTVDVGVLGQVWVHPDHPEPFVDFNTEHKYRNFEEIREWAERNQLPEAVPNDFLQPPKIGDRVYEEIP